ncbi:MAG: TIGR04283 family arsenosugar biosynthesis glycosyltransferase [Pseudomonadales bacterium]
MSHDQPRVSIIIPALNEAPVIESLLGQLQTLRQYGCEVLLADGGSCDTTVDLARPLVDKVLESSAGRSLQMNAGASQSQAEWLWFLHADASLLHNPSVYLECILSASRWGFFPVRLSGHQILLRVIEKAMRWRSSLTGVATGDQGLFVRRDVFERAGGYENVPLMEDVALTKVLRRVAAPTVASSVLGASSRRWEQRGLISTIVLMWRLRFDYWRGVSPQQLAVRYL